VSIDMNEPLETAKNCLREALGALMEVSDRQRQVDDLAMLVRMLVRHVPDDKKIKAKALDYLKRHGLQGSPIRETTDI
jgi:SOS response regulatory protein OraA/RecX